MSSRVGGQREWRRNRPPANKDSYAIVVTVGGAPGRRSDNKVDPAKVAAGEYTVEFPEDVDNWLWLANLAPTDATAQPPGMVTVEQEVMTKTTLHVRTFNAAGAATDRPFHLRVTRIS